MAGDGWKGKTNGNFQEWVGFWLRLTSQVDEHSCGGWRESAQKQNVSELSRQVIGWHKGPLTLKDSQTLSFLKVLLETQLILLKFHTLWSIRGTHFPQPLINVPFSVLLLQHPVDTEMGYFTFWLHIHLTCCCEGTHSTKIEVGCSSPTWVITEWLRLAPGQAALSHLGLPLSRATEAESSGQGPEICIFNKSKV